MRVAVLDLGTNSFLMTIAEIIDCKVERVLAEYCEIVRIGKGLRETGKISNSSIDRGLTALKYYSDEMKRHSVEKVAAVGTSALREAKNSREFIHLVREKLGIDIEVISGEREALLTWKGSVTGIELPPSSSPVVVDIGGGSTEFVWNKGRARLSIPFGVVKGFESYLKSDPPTKDEISKLREEFRGLLRRDLSNRIAPSPLVIAVAGTATTVLAIAKGVEPYDPAEIHGYKLTLSQLKETISLLTSLPLEDRKKIPGLHPGRADVIIAGAVLLEEVFLFLNISEAIISDRGVRYGLALELAGC